jgi:hypothetical protein
VNYRELDPVQASNQIGKKGHSYQVHAKDGEACALDAGHASKQIGQQQKITKFRDINFNFVLISYFA